MKVMATIDNKKILVRIINNNYNAQAKEVIILEGINKGVHTIVENKDIVSMKVKFTSKVSYDTSREEEYNGTKWINRITGRYFTINITSNSEENCNDLLYSLENYINSEYKNKKFARCGECEAISSNKFELYDTIQVDNKEEYDELTKIYKQWKVNNR